MIKEILKTIQLNGLTWSGTDKKTANVPAGNDFVFNVNNLPEFSETYPNPEEFTILYKDESNVMRQLTCTNVSNGVTKYIFAYKIDNDVINLSIFKSDGHLEINIRNNKLEYPINLDSVEFQVKYDDGEQPTPGDDELIDDTYEIKLRSTTTFNRYAIVDTEVTMKKPDNKAVNYVADEAVVKVNGVEVSGGGGYPEPTGTIEITENGTANVKDYAEANVNVPTYPEPAGTITITENGTVNVKDYAEASVNVSGSAGEGFVEVLTCELIFSSGSGGIGTNNEKGNEFANLLTNPEYENADFMFVNQSDIPDKCVGGNLGYISEVYEEEETFNGIIFECGEGLVGTLHNVGNTLYANLANYPDGDTTYLYLYAKKQEEA